MYNINVFYNDNGVLNRNKLRESWVKNNLSELYLCVVSYELPNDITHFSQKMYHYIHDINDYPKCKYCGLDNKRYQSFSTGYTEFCSKSCSLAFVRPKLEKKRRENTIEKYGVEHTSMLKSTKERQKNTNEKLYGYVSPACNDIIIDKIKATNLERYGVEYVMQNDDIKNLYINNRIKEARSEVIGKYKLNVLNYDGELFEILCDKCNKIYECNRHLLYQRIERYKVTPCINCKPLDSNGSSYEEELYKYLIKFNTNIIRNYRIDGKEIDIYLPDFSLGIEINGLYWHSEIHKGKNYHIDKTNFFKSNGIKILHIWEDDWLSRADIVKSIILNKINVTKNRIYARSCVIKEYSNKEIKTFLINNHIQGYINSKICLGLFYENTLVSVMTFSDKRHIKNDSWEIIRFCNKLNYNIIGGASKLFKYFMNNYDVKSIVSYAKCDYTDIDDNVYKKLGFEFDKSTKPGYYWCKNQIRYNRYNFRKDKLVKNGYDKTKTESQIMNERGYYRIWDSGNLKFVYSL